MATGGAVLRVPEHKLSSMDCKRSVYSGAVVLVGAIMGYIIVTVLPCADECSCLSDLPHAPYAGRFHMLYHQLKYENPNKLKSLYM